MPSHFIVCDACRTHHAPKSQNIFQEKDEIDDVMKSRNKPETQKFKSMEQSPLRYFNSSLKKDSYKSTLTQNNKITRAAYDMSLLKYSYNSFINNNKMPVTVNYSNER